MTEGANLQQHSETGIIVVIFKDFINVLKQL